MVFRSQERSVVEEAEAADKDFKARAAKRRAQIAKFCPR